jgi:hypothetical protein
MTDKNIQISGLKRAIILSWLTVNWWKKSKWKRKAYI